MLYLKIRGKRSVPLTLLMIILSLLTACGGGGGDSAGGTDNANNQVSCADGVAFVAIEGARGYISTSPDGECWNRRVASTFYTMGVAKQIAYDGTSYLVAGYVYPYPNPYVAHLVGSSSLEGAAWGSTLTHSNGTYSQFDTVAYDSNTGIYVVGGNNSVYRGTLGALTQVVSESSSLYIGTGASGVFFNPSINRVSTDAGETWSDMTTGPNSLQPSACSNAPFGSAYRYNSTSGAHVYIGARCNGVMRSAEASSWELISGTSFTGLQDIAYGNGMFVTVGQGTNPDNKGEIWMSDDDGDTWTDVTPNDSTGIIHKITYGHGKFVAAGSGFVYTSIDGTNWTRHNVSFSGIADVIAIQ